MNSRKRQASDSLVRQPKQQRLTLNRCDGEASSPSQIEGLGARWWRVGGEVVMLTADTVSHIFSALTLGYKSKDVEEKEESPEPVSASSDVQAPFSMKEDAQNPLGDDDPVVALDITTSIPTPPPEPALLTSTPRYSRARSSLISILEEKLPDLDFSAPRIPSSQPTHQREESSSGHRPAIPSFSASQTSTSHRSSTSTPVFSSQPTSWTRSSTDITEQSSRLSSTSSAPNSKTRRRNPRQREHIYGKAATAVVENRRRLREEMLGDIFEIKRRKGFTSGFSDFRGLLDYQRKLQDIKLDNPPIPAVSVLGDVHAARSRKVNEDDEVDFLQRVLDNAKATLNSPKPPKPFIPSFEQLQISHRAKDEDIERRLRPSAPPLPSSLPPTDEKAVHQFLSKHGVIAKFDREQVSDQDIRRLQPGQWLNDEVINFYGAMILARAEKAPKAKDQKQLLNAHYFSSFFWSKLTKEGYEKGRLAKWTKKLDIFSKDVILIPVNHSNAHWTAAAINFKRKRIESYDSMGMAKDIVFRHLRAYLEAEHLNKRKKPFDFTGWENWAPDETPQQENGYDCGVFTCQFLESLSRGMEVFNFSQKDMPYLRRRMIWEIGHTKLWQT